MIKIIFHGTSFPISGLPVQIKCLEMVRSSGYIAGKPGYSKLGILVARFVGNVDNCETIVSNIADMLPQLGH